MRQGLRGCSLACIFAGTARHDCVGGNNGRVHRALLILLAIAASLALGACGGGESSAGSQAPVADPAPAPVVAAPDAEQGLEFPAQGTPLITVRPDKQVEVRSSPGGKLVDQLGSTTEFGSPTVLSVQRRRGQWVGVPTSLLPNGKLGWVKLDPKRLRAGASDFEIRVDLSQRRAELLHAGKVERSWSVSIGVPETPTPTGHFSVTDTFRDELSSVYGCCAVALTARQPSLPPDWPGGDRIAIHGTEGELGVAISNGCIRSPNADVSKLVDTVPLGTPVTIGN